MLVLIYLPRKDGKLSWLRWERKSHKSVQILAEPGIELGTLWLEGRDLANCAKHVLPLCYNWLIPWRFNSTDNDFVSVNYDCGSDAGSFSDYGNDTDNGSGHGTDTRNGVG